MAASSQALQGSIANLLGLEAQATEADAAARAQGTSAAGYGLEIDAYGRAIDTSNYNVGLEGVAGDIRVLQQERELNRSIGGIRAASAGAGFKESGSTIDLLRSSMQEGYLTQAITRTQTAANQAGYIEQALAATMQMGAAGLAQQSALETQQAQTEAASLARAQAANQTAALTKYLSDAGLDEEGELALGVLAGTTIADDLTQVSPGGVPVSYGLRGAPAGAVDLTERASRSSWGLR